MVATLILAVAAVVGLQLLCYLYRLVRVWRVSFKGAHVVVTGGSTGIGKALSAEFVKAGANVTIMARTKSKLEAAVAELRKFTSVEGQRVDFVSVDVTDAEGVARAFEGCEETQPVDVLVTSAGQSWPGYFMDQDSAVFRKHMDLNYFGTLHAAKAVAPSMCERGRGRIVFVSSAVAGAAFIGYAAYAPTKFAVRGLADVLRNELGGFGVSVSIAYPPDTESPGFENENKTKPVECQNISKIGDVFKAEDVAARIIEGIRAGDYHIASPDFVQNRLIGALSAGTTPRPSYLFDLVMSPLWGIAAECFAAFCDYHARSYATSKQRKTRDGKQE